MKKKTVNPDRICFECLHYEACQSWNIGSLVKTSADNCVNYRASVNRGNVTEENQKPMTNEDYLKSKTGRSLAIALAAISGHEGNPDQADVDYIECWLKQEAK